MWGYLIEYLLEVILTSCVAGTPRYTMPARQKKYVQSIFATQSRLDANSALNVTSQAAGYNKTFPYSYDIGAKMCTHS